MEEKEINDSLYWKKKRKLNPFSIDIKKNYSIFSKLLTIDKLFKWGEKSGKIFNEFNFTNSIDFLNYPSFFSCLIFNLSENSEKKKKVFSTKIWQKKT